MQKVEKKCEDVIKIFFSPAKSKFSYKWPIKKKNTPKTKAT